MIMNVKRPFASYIAAPFGLGPHGSTLLPSGFTSWAETNIQVPTSCSLIDFCWPTAVLGADAAATAMIADALTILRQFMFFLPGFACLRAHGLVRGRTGCA